MEYIVDRVEEGFAVLVSSADSSVKNVPACELDGIKEGDVLTFEDGRYVHLQKKSEDRKESLAERFNKLKNK